MSRQIVCEFVILSLMTSILQVYCGCDEMITLLAPHDATLSYKKVTVFTFQPSQPITIKLVFILCTFQLTITSFKTKYSIISTKIELCYLLKVGDKFWYLKTKQVQDYLFYWSNQQIVLRMWFINSNTHLQT